MSDNFSLDHITLLIVLIGFIPFFTWRSLKAVGAARWGKFIYCLVIALFVLRLAYLRVATNSGLNGFYDPANLQFTKELGDPLVFFISIVMLFGAVIYRLIDDDNYIKKNYVSREAYDLIVAQLAALKGEGNKTNEPE